MHHGGCCRCGLCRAVEIDASGKFHGAFIPVDSEGTANANSLWLNTNTAAPTVGTTAITFVQLNKGTDLSAGNQITISGNSIKVSDFAAAGLLGATAAGATAQLTAPQARVAANIEGITTHGDSAYNIAATDRWSQPMRRLPRRELGRCLTLMPSTPASRFHSSDI